MHFTHSFVFGRFNIPTNGHRHILEEAARLAENVHVGVSSSMRNSKINGYVRINRLREFLATDSFSFSLESNLFDFLKRFNTESSVLVISEDNSSMLRLCSYFPDLSIHVLPRNAQSPSSTQVRRILRENKNALEQLINEGLVNSLREAQISREAFIEEIL
jgi:cytidyltransferase-like protein